MEAEGDDEYEDEDDEARGKARSKMRAIDDGTRRPSLPTNSLIPSSSTSSVSPPPTSNASSEASPGGRSTRSQESDFESSEAEGDEAETAEFDTDVELDMPQGNAGGTSMDPPVSDAASQRTFGAGIFDHYGYWQPPQRAEAESVYHDEEDEEEDVGSISPVTFTREYDSEGYDDGDRPLPSLGSQAVRRGSLPWETLTPRVSSGGREREDSTLTITGRRASRSTDDLAGNPAEEPQQPRFDDQMHEPPTASTSHQGEISNDEYTYGPYDLEYIMDGIELRKSWSSGAPSYIQAGSRRSDGDPGGLGAAWDSEYIRNARRPSTVTIGSSEDAFTRHVRALDPDYNAREERWSFRKENTDGRGPYRLNLSTTPSAANANVPAAVTSFTMPPGTQEMWRQEFVGRFKVDRLRISRKWSPFM